MVGCFSWCSGPHDLDTPEVKARIKSGMAACTKEVSVTPTAEDYALEATADAIIVIKAAMGVVGGVPGAQQVLELALVLIQTCGDITEIEERVSILSDRIESIMLVMVNCIEGKESATIPQGILKDIEKLGTDMEKIKQDLGQIATQSRLLTILFKNANKAKIDNCIDLLKNSLVHWQISRDISNGVALHNMQQGIDRVNEQFNDVQKSIAVIRHAHTAQHSSFRPMPSKPAIFYGRDEYVEDMVKILLNSSKPPRICIHGPAGMGKTSAAIAVMEHPDIVNKFRENDRFWVPCVSATSPDILLQILYSNLRISRDTGNYLADIITELRSSPAARLILLDNFETPWDPTEGKREDVENVLCALAESSQLSILVTMRTNIPPSEHIDWIDKPLDAVDAETSHDIYCAIHPRAKGKPKLSELLVELGHMPYAVMLVATLGKASKATPDMLLKDWRRLGPKMLASDSLEDSISRSIGLSMNSKQIVKNASARTLLATLSMLPAGTTHSRLEKWTPTIDNKNIAIAALNNVALVVDIEEDDSDEVLISVLPVIQSYMQRDRIPVEVRLNVREACYKFVLEHKSSPGDPRFKDDLLILSSEELNIQSILLEAARIINTTPHLTSSSIPNIQKSLEVLVAFSWYQHWKRPRTEVIEHTLNVARRVRDQHYIAEALFCLGSILFRLDKYQDACKCYLEARDHFKKLSNIASASECSFELADIYMYMQDPTKAEEIVRDVSEAGINADKYLEARRQMVLGRFSLWRYQFSTALDHLNVAKEAFSTKELNRHVDSAYCLHLIARSLVSIGKPSEALQPINQALDIYERSGPDNRLVDTLLIKTIILLRAQSPDPEVLKTLQCTLQKSQELGGPLSIAQALEFFGEVYIRQRDVSTAQKFYEAAQSQYETLGNTYMSRSGVSRCQSNRRELALMQDNLEIEWKVQLLSSHMSRTTTSS